MNLYAFTASLVFSKLHSPFEFFEINISSCFAIKLERWPTLKITESFNSVLNKS